MTVTKELNGAYDTVANTAGTGTSVTPANPSRWPDPATVGPYPISLWPTSVPYTNDVGERAMVTAKTAGVLTVVRQIEGSSSRSVIIGDQMALGWGAQDGRGALAVGERNLLRNPGFSICQRVDPAGAAISAPAYCADGWYVLTQTAAITYTRSLSSLYLAQYSGLFTQPQASAQRMGVLQVIPANRTIPLRGEPVRFDFKSNATTTLTLRYAILEWTGTADSVTKNVVNSWTNSTYTAGQFFASTTLNVLAVGSISTTTTPATLASIRATVGASANNLIVFVWTEATAAQNVAVAVSDCWLVPDTVSAPFTPRSAALELAICQAYYEKSYDLDTPPGSVATLGRHITAMPQTAASDFLILTVPYRRPKRSATVTVRLWDRSGNGGGTAKIAEITAGGSVTANVAPSVGATAAQQSFVLTHDPSGSILGVEFHYDADSEL